MGIPNDYTSKAPFSVLSQNNLEIPDEQEEEDYEETSNNMSPNSNKEIKYYMENEVSEKSSIREAAFQRKLNANF